MMDHLSVIVLSILVLAFLCWKEYKRKNRANLALRLTTSGLAVIALYFIALPPSFRRQLDPGKQNTIILLTKGFNETSLAKLKNIPLFSTDQSIVSGNKDVGLVADMRYFVNTNADINKIHILGEGLEMEDLKALQSHQLIFHPADISGLSAVHWNRTIRSGDQLSIQGTYQNQSDKAAKLILKGLSTTLDSLTIPASQTQTFELRTNPKQIGQALFSIIALSGTDTLANEKVPVAIKRPEPLKILMLSSSPDFESKFLKNWLYTEKFGIASRTSISKDKYNTEFLNSEKVNLNRITTSLLEKFDLLIGDMTELSAMSAAESSAVQYQLSKGMGILIRANETEGTRFYKQAFKLRENKNIDQKRTLLLWDGMKALKTSAPSGQSLEFIPSPDEQVLVKDSKNHSLAGLKLYGSGRIALSTINDTYTWMLSNNSSLYSSYWSYILSKAARKKNLKESWSHTQLPSIHEQASLRLESNTSSLPTATIENSVLRFSQDPAMFFSWTAKYWPSEGGWQSIRSGKEEYPWYIFERQNWQSIRAAQKIKNTKSFIGTRKKIVPQTTGLIQKYTYTIPAIYFFLLFLIACGYLWVEGKLASK